MSQKHLIVTGGSAWSTDLLMREDGEDVGTVLVAYGDDRLVITVSRIDESATGPVEVIVR